MSCAIARDCLCPQRRCGAKVFELRAAVTCRHAAACDGVPQTALTDQALIRRIRRP
ncbi:hypothetical protein XMIN_2515 [Xanthomonas citri pv. mangiferaeindicae LMG 941]|nr:hypothetical protein XMIN_2515 [Xanthomonas citri pv. mangiferaeindicae LMG 941]